MMPIHIYRNKIFRNLLKNGITLISLLNICLNIVVWSGLGRDTSRSSSFSSGKRSTKPGTGNINIGQPVGGSGGGGGSSHQSAVINSMSSRGYVKKETTQLSPVKKRIKENKDHYIGNLLFSFSDHKQGDIILVLFYLNLIL